MLTEICQYLKNWFDRDKAKYHGKFEISNGSIVSFNDGDMGLQLGQYFRIIGSLFNDGVVKYGTTELTDEVFEGSVWFIAIPKDFLSMVAEIEAWQAKFGGVDSEAMSPFNSESFGGYSYSKSGGGASDGSTNAGTWQAAFGARLNAWRKV